jgi:hypothetical protein
MAIGVAVLSDPLLRERFACRDGGAARNISPEITFGFEFWWLDPELELDLASIFLEDSDPDRTSKSFRADWSMPILFAAAKSCCKASVSGAPLPVPESGTNSWARGETGGDPGSILDGD